MNLRFIALALVLFQAGGGPVVAQAQSQGQSIEESGALDRRAPTEPVDDKAFDCPAFKVVIAAAPDGFAALRGAVAREDETLAAYSVASPLFGACEILDKKKISEISYSCQASSLDLADVKATIDSCLGESAQHYASNENPNTPFLRYNVAVAGRQARVMALKTFGKVTLAVFNPR
ncbi:hypothetical protein CCR94_09485 [Rhodoblastus sphagnicola]|uniref:Uncharacterized protein n=1 Tax=Rhodoblastus sphagnicola TaxID=333368 RepID=A0A2S6N9S5_9HYPH|nr:hypothetical protein [Rhodoblastus sphagnicola]MBB4198199.1 hypothetical protein [Rhodoblastus sphagnicola]PPQ31365.1 hypothetical protein CCR94_09485 [Rhodoblastus sphagnicola]